MSRPGLGRPPRAAALILTLAAAPLLAGSCVPLPFSPAVGGGTVTIGDSAEPDSMLAAGITGSDPNALALAGPVMEGLLAARPPGAAGGSAGGPADYWQPQLALSVPTLANGGVRLAGAGMEVTWRLRPGVRWQDGRPFTSRDVWATFQLHWLRYRDRNPTPGVSTAGWDQVTGVSTPDPLTAVVRFKSVYGPYLTLGSGPYGVMPDHLLEPSWAKGGDLTRVRLPIHLPGAYQGVASWDRWLVGTGPYMFKDWVPGDHLTLVRNPLWWGGRARLGYIYVRFEPDPATELAELRSGTIDLGLDMGAAALGAIGDIRGARADTLGGPGVEKLDLNLRNRYLADPAVRRAVLMAIDRPAIVDILLGGRTGVPPDAWLCTGTGSWCRDPALPTTAYDRAGAAALLDRAGYGLQTGGAGRGFRVFRDGSTIQLRLVRAAGDPFEAMVAAVLRTELEAVGIRIVEPARQPEADQLEGDFQDGGLLSSHSFDLALHAAAYAAPAEPAALAAAYRCDGIAGGGGKGTGANDTSVCSSTLDAALAAAAATADPAARRRAYGAAQLELARVLPEIPLYRQLLIMGLGSRLHGYHGDGFFWLDGCQRWWVAS